MSPHNYISKLSGVVVLYEPDELVLSNIESYIGILEYLFIIDNSKTEQVDIREHFINQSKVRYVFNNGNIGVAAALNMGAKLSMDAKCNWLLTMDQDSSFMKESLTKYHTEFEHFRTISELGVIGIQHDNKLPVTKSQPRFENVNAVITSGSLINLNIWQLAGGFSDALFIDEVDHEYCYRIIKQGFMVIALNHVFLNHRMGSLKAAGYFGLLMKRERMIHSPLRIYYIIRNYLFVRKIYKTLLPDEFRTRDKQIKVILKNNILFSGSAIATLRMAIKGYLDFRKGVFGKYK